MTLMTGEVRATNRHLVRHPGEGRDPCIRIDAVEPWIPAFAGMTI
jgi:hypothetical protein